MSMLLHELATNAAKYGSLSLPDGRVDLSWEIETDSPEPTLTVTWKESGGPIVAEPVRSGFGSRLIQLGLLGNGDAEKRYLQGGLVATFRGSLKDIREL
jgi:two-component sensor histidine kinase